MRHWLLVSLFALAVSSPAVVSASPACWRQPPTMPVTLEEADIFRDGGTLYVMFVDARGCRYRITHDRRVGAGGPRCLYINATHPTHAGATMLDPAGDVAGQAANALEHWLQSAYGRPTLMRIASATSMAELTREEASGARVFDMVRTIRSAPCPGRRAGGSSRTVACYRSRPRSLGIDNRHEECQGGRAMTCGSG